MIPVTNNGIKKFNNSRLSVQVSLNGLSFLSIDKGSGKPSFFTEKQLEHSTTPEELLLEIEKIIRQHEILQGNFEEVSIIYSTPTYSLVPNDLFDESRASEYLKFNTKILANDYIAHDLLEKQDLIVVYVPFMNVNNFFFEKYGSFEYYHNISVLIKTLLKEDSYFLPKMFLHFQKNTFDCLVLKDAKLQLCNTYSYQTPEDFIYYTLFVMEQLKLDPETIPVSLCGTISEEDDLYKMAYTYIRHLDFIKEKESSLILDGNKDSHHHFTLKHV